MKPLHALIGLALLQASTPVLKAAVEPVAIMLAGSIEQARYVVPAGKVLIIEQVMFCDWWDGQSDPKQIVIMHSTNPVGTVWQTTIRYSTAYNTLTRPLRVPASKAVTITHYDNSLFRCWLYGLLVGQEDLYAAVPATIEDVQAGPSPDGVTVLQGTITLASNRPAAVRVMGSDDLDTWQPESSARVASTENPATKTLDFESNKPKRFLRAEARALPRDEPIFIARKLPPIILP